MLRKNGPSTVSPKSNAKRRSARLMQAIRKVQEVGVSQQSKKNLRLAYCRSACRDPES